MGGVRGWGGSCSNNNSRIGCLGSHAQNSSPADQATMRGPRDMQACGRCIWGTLSNTSQTNAHNTIIMHHMCHSARPLCFHHLEQMNTASLCITCATARARSAPRRRRPLCPVHAGGGRRACHGLMHAASHAFKARSGGCTAPYLKTRGGASRPVHRRRAGATPTHQMHTSK